MKIRIKGNSIRYRLTRTDMQTLAGTGSVAETIHFGTDKLTYELCSSTNLEISAGYRQNRISIYLPQTWISDWVQNDVVGFNRNIPQPGNAGTLHVLVEKDFTCLDASSENQHDHYPNPQIHIPHEHK